MRNNSGKRKIINYSQGKNLKVRLRGKRLSNGNISLYLDYYQGYTKNVDEKIKTRRKVEYLKIYISDNPKSPEERKKNEENLSLAQQIRNNRESDLQFNAEGLIAPFRKKTNFFDYCYSFEERYQKKDIRMIKLAIAQFKEYTKEDFLTPLQIDQARITGFRDFLLNKYHGETPNSVFARFKKILNAATDEGLFTKNPAEKVTCRVPDGIPKEILTVEEVVKLATAKCGNPDVKRAFLLCLNTGLRFCDVTDLKYKHITNGLIKKPQQKTGREVTIDLNQTATRLIGEMGLPEEFVYNLPSFNACIKTLRSWAKRAEINKRITWHSARHSFATILLMNKTDIKTVGNLLGHSKIEHTQKYTHIVDELKLKAINSLPEISL
jgi:site-specific recombinase XerD